MIRIAAIGDVHYSEDSRGRLCPYWSTVHESADVLVLAGDLTGHGETRQVEVLADDLECVRIPIVAVLGNHEYHCGEQDEIRRVLERRGVTVLECEATTLAVGGTTLGIAGTKGFGGGFVGACGHNFGEPEMKAFVAHTIERADRLRTALSSLDTDVRIVLTHYSPIPETLRGEPPEIYPFLGCYQLGEVIDECGADLALHGHAHFGCEQGVTPGGTRVRNVAQPVIRSAYATYGLNT